MIQSIISEAHGPLLFVPAFPKGYRGPRIAGSQALSSTGDFGSIIVQDFAGELFNIRYIILRFFQKMILHRFEEEKLRAQFVLRENLRYKRDRKTIKVNSGDYNLVWAPGKETVFHFGKGKEYHLLHIYYEPELVRHLKPSFPGKNSVPDERLIQLIRPQFKETVNQILEVPFRGDVIRFYYENQVRDLLFYMLFSTSECKELEGLSPEEIARVNKVEQIILENLSTHYTIPELADKAKMSEFRLKAAFKKVTGMGMFERLKEARLQRACRLLTETDEQVTIIFEKVGYESITGFIDAFKKRFGISPTKYRKRYKLKD
ncbi:MAG: helix-turn-helix domain-containing protein [Flavisolibacter sp.]